MTIKFDVNRERFPYEVYVEGNRVAVLYSSHAVDLLENVVRCNELVLQYAQRVNRLVAIVEGKKQPGPGDLVPVKEVRYSSLSLSPAEILHVAGIEVGQRYTWAHSATQWEITALSGLARVATLAWVEDLTTGKLSSTYVKSVDFDRLKKAYTLKGKKGASNGTSDDEQDEADYLNETTLEELGI